ncbi:MAG: hypothetical protein H6541_04150 [Lentimicrobiaceae bacterium]|nr:hypothetical protein [Lentimicrobiaceae bacterium]MCO5265829.1 hypothetical protein [Lentimicrobium sp.]
MKKTSLILVMALLSFGLMAQQPKKTREIGLTFQNFDNFGLSYKTGNEKALWRFNYLNVNAAKSNSSNPDYYSEKNSTGFGFGTAIGRECRKTIDTKLEARFGADVNFSFNYTKKEFTQNSFNNQRTIKTTRYSPGINAVAGINYNISNKLLVGVEVKPGLNYSIAEEVVSEPGVTGESKNDLSSFNFGLSSSAAQLTLGYRF